MSLVYRIQSKQDRTRGAYHSHIFGDRRPMVAIQMSAQHSDNKHPCPYCDIGINRGTRYGNEYHGFNRATDLLRWFKGFIPDLLRAGYEIVALQNVTITAVGEYQVLFTFND